MFDDYLYNCKLRFGLDKKWNGFVFNGNCWVL